MINLPWDLSRKVIPVIRKTARPTEDDVNYNIPTLWLDETNNKAYILVDVTAGVATWSAAIGANVNLDFQNSVLSIATATNAPPTEVSGNRYIIGATGTPHANWDGAANNDIVEFDGAKWVATTPTEGMICEVEDVNTIYLYLTSWAAWQNQATTTTSDVTFATVNSTTAHTTTQLTDHLGEHTGGHGVLYDTAIVDNTATTQIATATYAKSQDAVLAREPDQGVAMTAATSGSSGITVADNDNIDFGTGNFTLVWKGSLPDWTASKIAVWKYISSTGYILQVNAGTVLCTLNSASFASSTFPLLTNNSVHEIVATFTVGDTNTVANFYIDGVMFGSSVSVANPGSISNSTSLQILGYNDIRTAGTVHHAITYNRALTTAEVLDLYRNGVSEADKWGSQTNISAATWINASALYTYETFDGASATGFHANKSSGSAAHCFSGTVIPSGKIGDRYLVTFDITVESGVLNGGIGLVPTDTAYISDWLSNVPGFVAGSNSLVLTTTSTAECRVGISINGPLEQTVSNFKIVKLGATLCLVPELAQPSPGQWLDASTNKLHARYPAAGATLTRPKQDFTIKWTNTWAASHELQYLGGINQEILPANAYIESIIGVVSGATIEDIIVGDGSDTDRWVEVTTGLAAGTYSFAIANRISDGSNFKMTVDPDNNMTGSIAWTIRGIILQT